MTDYCNDIGTINLVYGFIMGALITSVIFLSALTIKAIKEDRG